MSVVLWWMRRDLRLEDNSVIQYAQSAGHSIIPIFILDPHLLNLTAPARLSFLFEGLRFLDRKLQHEHGTRLIVRSGIPAEELAWLSSETGAAKILAEEDYS